jgi:hypothetical protein
MILYRELCVKLFLIRLVASFLTGFWAISRCECLSRRVCTVGERAISPQPGTSGPRAALSDFLRLLGKADQFAGQVAVFA